MKQDIGTSMGVLTYTSLLDVYEDESPSFLRALVDSASTKSQSYVSSVVTDASSKCAYNVLAWLMTTIQPSLKCSVSWLTQVTGYTVHASQIQTDILASSLPGAHSYTGLRSHLQKCSDVWKGGNFYPNDNDIVVAMYDNAGNYKGAPCGVGKAKPVIATVRAMATKRVRPNCPRIQFESRHMLLQPQESVPENFHKVSVDGKKLLRDVMSSLVAVDLPWVE